MIKVLIITTVGLGFYGITNSVMNYYRNMDKTEFQIDFVNPAIIPERLKKEINDSGGTVYEIIMRNYRPLSYMGHLAKIIKKGNYDIVHCHGNSATLAVELVVAKLCKVKVRIAHSHNSTCDHMRVHNVLKPLFHLSYTHAFACSEKAGNWIYGSKPFTVIHNGIPVKNFFYKEETREQYRKLLGYEENKVIGHVGHFSYQKNHEFLVQVFSKLYKKDHNYRLLLIGDGDLQGEVRKLVKELELEAAVTYYGETLEVSNLLQAMDVFVFPSRFEGLGIVVIEAQTSGLPCIVSDEIPIEAKVTDLIHYLSLNDSLDTWADKIIELEEMDRNENAMRVQEVMKQSQYSIENEVGKLQNLYYEYVMKK